MSPWPSNAMGHQHQWQTEPPERRLYFNKTFDQRYADEEDLATNSMLTSPEEIQHLRCMLEKDPDYKNSPRWPKLTEWCSSCTMTRLVDLVLFTEEEKVVKNEILFKIKEEKIDDVVKEEKGDSFMDASTQTAPERKKRGGQGSRRWRLLAFQLMLTQRQGLPKSRLLYLAEKGARSPGKRRTSTTQPVLKEEKVEVKQEKDDVHDEEKKEDGRSNSEEASAGGSSTNFTPRSFQSGVFTPSSQPFSQVPSMPLNSACFTPSFQPYFMHLLCGQMPWPQPVLCGACQAWGTVHPCLLVS